MLLKAQQEQQNRQGNPGSRLGSQVGMGGRINLPKPPQKTVLALSGVAIGVVGRTF